MAMSATLKIPVRTGPIPRLRKSVTRPPCETRSMRLPMPASQNQGPCREVPRRHVAAENQHIAENHQQRPVDDCQTPESQAGLEIAPHPEKGARVPGRTPAAAACRRGMTGGAAAPGSGVAILLVTWSQPTAETSTAKSVPRRVRRLAFMSWPCHEKRSRPPPGGTIRPTENRA